MLTDEQRKALNIAATNGYLSARERASIRELLAASAAPAEGREPTGSPNLTIEEDPRDGNWREFRVNGHCGFIRIVARMEGDEQDLPLGEQVAQFLLTASAKPAEGRDVKAYLYQHKQSGKTTFVTPELSRDEFEGMNPEYAYVGALVLATAPMVSEVARDVLWRHKKTGGVYRFVAESRMERDPKAVVVTYRNIKTGETWTRPYGEFYDGRFERIDRAAAKGESDA